MDKDSKIIGDKTWDVFGNNTIFLLENGGGKTSVIQLLHQVVLPNHSIQKREMVNGVQKDSTRHIAVEWISDDEHHPNFVTGFCFHNYGIKRSKDDNRTYNYFNYIFEYDNKDGLRLEDLPFTQTGHVTNLEQLKKGLKQVPGVHFFESNKEYREALEQYGLLETEWRNIAKVNGEEGGVTEFFDSTNKTVTLIERLLIPSLTESLYDTPEERRAILESFRKYQKGLLELPELEKDLQDFEVIANHSDPIIDSFERYEGAMNELKYAKENLTKLYVTLSNKANQNENLLTQIEKELSEMNEQKALLEWKIDSYQAHLLEEETKKYAQEYEETKYGFEQLKKEEQLIQTKIKEQKAANQFRRYRDHSRKANDIESKLRVAEIDAEERNGEFMKAKKDVSEQYRYLLDQQQTKKRECEDEADTINQQRKENDIELETEQKEQSNLEKQIAKLETIVDQYRRDKLSIQNKMGEFWEKDAITTEENLQKESETEKKQHEDTEHKLTKVSSEINNLRERKIHLENDIPNTRKDLDSVENQFDSFVKKETFIKEDLVSAINLPLSDDIFEGKDTILFNLDRKQNGLKNEHTKLSVSVDHLVQLKNGIEQRGYHVHAEIEEIIEYLTQKGIDVISGVEWITNLASGNDEKNAMLKKSPMLSFSVLVETSQINDIKNALRLFKRELTVPIIFLDRLQMDQQQEKDNFYPLEEHLYVFHQFNVRLTSEDWEKYVRSLEEVIEEKQSEERVLNGKLEKLNHIVYELKAFLKEFNAYTRDKFSKQIKSLKGTIRAQLNEKQEIESKMVELGKEKEEIDSVLNQIKKKIVSIEEKRLFIQDFMQRYSDIEDKFKELTTTQSLLQTTLNKVKELKHKNGILEDKLEFVQRKIMGTEDKIDHLERDFKEYNFESTETQMPTDEGTYEKIKSYYNQLRNKDSFAQAQIENLQSSLNTYQEFMNEAVNEIEKNGFSIESMQRLQIGYDERLLDQLNLDHESIDEEIRETDISLAVLQDKKERNEKEIEKALDKIEDIYQKSPFNYDQTAESEYELYNSEKESLVVKQENLIEKYNELTNSVNLFKTAVEELERRQDYFVRIQDMVPFEDGQWDNIKPMNDVHRYRDAIEKQQRKIVDRKQEIQNNIWNLKDDAQKTENAHLIHSLKQFIKIFEGSNYDETINNFYKMLEGIDGYRKSLESRKKHSEHSRNELIEQMYQRSEVIHKNVVDIAKSSQIEEDGKIVNLIKINWPKNEYNHAMHQFRLFVDGVLEELVKLKNSGSTEKEIEKKFDSLASLFNIVNCYAEVTKCNIKVLKPKTELLSANKEYVTWDKIDSEWSGGEKQTARISMFISFLNHLRKTRFAKEVSWKVLVFDNPFDKMQSDHVVRPMIELAKKTNTQLFCFTGINDKSIQQEFDTVISNQYVVQHGSLLLESEVKHKKTEPSLETLFYAR
ncbi:hypothetical protein [Siminovitchia fortis]|uniref:hypothetical protein n=2 Tax=Bacillales TaxID=1385 RepID=UPI0011A36E87|nr:hypothetical protein [Siminovitchia fortis]